MSHPSCCKNPATCTLSYREHLVGFGLSANAVPTRRVTRTPGLPDEPTTQTLIRERRWERDMAAYKRLRKEGLQPRRMETSAARERYGETVYDIEHRPFTIDYNDPN